jgi:ABC-type transport system involved in cytochrome c biogenesis ATPase subunit
VSEAAVETFGLTKRFHRQVAVNAVDLAVPRGGVYGFLGPNGSGKTTTIRLLLGLIAPTTGHHALLGRPMPASAAEVLPRVGALVEGPAFHPYLSGRDNLHRLDAGDRTADPATARQRVDAALDRVGLLAAARKRYRVYSLGMRQRLALAGTLLGPRDTSSLVSQVRLAIDATEHLPLRVQILAKGSGQPAFEVGFTQVSFARPDNAQFQFTPPSGAKVTEPKDEPKADGKTDGKTDGRAPNKDLPNGTASKDQSTVIGKGWTSVFVTRTGDGSQPSAGNSNDPQANAAQGFLNSLPRSGNGRVLTSKLFTVMLTDDGRILFGAVSPERLAQVAADPAAQLK